MQGAKSVAHELRQCAEEYKADIICMQEPYSNNGKIIGLPISSTTITGSNDNPKAAINILNRSIETTKLTQFCDSHCVCVEIRSSVGTFYLVSVYCQFSDPIELHLSKLEKITRNLRGKNIIIAGDFNARSTTWFDRQTNQSGQEVEDFIERQQLYLANEPNQPCTFNLHGESNIDLTLATGGILNLIKNWSVYPDWTTSDHRAIVFDVCRVANVMENTISDSDGSRFNLKSASWDIFEANIFNQFCGTQCDIPIENTEDLENLATQITRKIISACEAAFPTRSLMRKCSPWWNEGLTAKKANVQRSRRKYQRVTVPERRQVLRNNYVQERNDYINAVNACRQASFEKFVSDHGNSEPWGIIYKFQLGKLRQKVILSTLLTNNLPTTSWEETSQVLLKTLLPDDSTENDTREQTEIRDQMHIEPDTDDAEGFSEEEVSLEVATLKKNKAPGIDKIEVEVIQRAWPYVKENVTWLLNNCLSLGTFPEIWKNGKVIILKKGGDRNEQDPKSYRPIVLLPVLGKLLEKLVSKRLMNKFQESGSYNSKQYGFRRGRSTEDAIVDMVNIVKASPSKYVLGIFMDIAGAFDNLWWPSIMKELKAMQCNRNIYKVIRSYLQDRSAILCDKYGHVGKTITKGCPQGSVLGPNLWNLVFNSSMMEGVNEVAFADDKVTLISGSSRLNIEEQAQLVVNKMVNWCRSYKMELSSSKTVMIQLKGKYDINRPPIIKIGEKRLKMVSSVRYLGVDFDERLGVSTHIKRITENATSAFHMMARLARTSWGLNSKTLMTIYKGITVPSLSYGSVGWFSRTNISHVKKLESAQRKSLPRITSAYRTTSYAAATVLAGVLPIKIILQEREALYSIRTNAGATYGNLVFPRDIENIPRAKIKKDIRYESQSTWNDEWQSSSKGRNTHVFLPCIKERLKMNIKLNINIVQFLTGHGRFAAYFHKHNITDSDRCTCSDVQETHTHVIYECQNFTEQRNRLIRNLTGINLQWPLPESQLIKDQASIHFNKFAKEVVEILNSREDV